MQTDYGEMRLPPVLRGYNALNGRFLKGHIPANKGKKWAEYMPKRSQQRCRRGWKNLDKYRNKNGRPDTAGRCRKSLVAVFSDGTFKVFSHADMAVLWMQCGNAENIRRCCRENERNKPLHDTHGRVLNKTNADHRYKGIRWYYETDNKWTKRIKQ